ncbi:hypothetical protein [Micromonospora sediminicola]|uniref:hypothetical protein n=1 Tax=Micromonospora sediminicola TaxID=946078 RepID=UPI0037967ED2
MFNKYGKAIASTFFAALVAVYAASSGDNHIEPTEWVAVAIAFAGALGTFVVPLAPEYRWGKTAVNTLLAVLQVLATLILGGLDSNEWILLLLTAGQALGVVVAPAVSDNGVPSKGTAPQVERTA